MTDRRVLGLIPARAGSKGVPRKNVRHIGGLPLIAHSINAGRSANCIDSIVVSTDDEEIAGIARECGARVPFLRPAELATDESPTEQVIDHALRTLAANGERYDDVVLLQPTSPLRTESHIDEAYHMYRNREADSLLSVYPTREIRWRKSSDGAEQINYIDAPKRRQDRDPEYVANGAVYVTDVEAFRDTGKITPGRTIIYEMSEVASIDIDTPFDLWLAERVMEDWQTDD